MADPIDDSILERVLDAARRVPSAGNSQGFDLVLLCGANETARYWDAALTPERRTGFRWSSLLRCPSLVTVWADPAAYVARYGEHDKQATGLGGGASEWATPYWTVDAAFAAMSLQYAAIDEGLGVLFFGMFEHGPAIARALGVPPEHQPIGTVALGWPDHEAEQQDRGGASAKRERRPLFASTGQAQMRPVVHRGSWQEA